MLGIRKKEDCGERGNSRTQQLEMNWDNGGGMGLEKKEHNLRVHLHIHMGIHTRKTELKSIRQP